MKTETTHADLLPVLPVRGNALFPGTASTLDVGRPASLEAVKRASEDDRRILVVPQLDPEIISPKPGDLFEIGVVGEILQAVRRDEHHLIITVRGLERVHTREYLPDFPYLVASVEPVATLVPEDGAAMAELVAEAVKHLAPIIAEQADAQIGDELMIEDADELVDLAAAHLDLGREEQFYLLREVDPELRLRKVLPHLQRFHEVLRRKEDIRSELSDRMSDYDHKKLLRERMQAIKEELGEQDDESELYELEERIAAAKMPDAVRQAAQRQLGRLRRMQDRSPEYTLTRTYLEWLLDMPWNGYTEDTLDVAAARAILDADHAGLEKVKRRIVEFIAVRKLAPEKQGPILCLVGPPGVGKTSLGRSIAASLGRRYVRVALGGVRDESAIRGHRRTYIGALPGQIASGLKKAGSMNPVFVLDEIDKLSAGMQGDPTAALLEVLDQEQNFEFSDHYLEVGLDLSKVLFIATANQLDTIPPALLDRLEVVEIPSYTARQKRVIARDHLLPKQLAEHGLEKDQLTVTDDALAAVIYSYTREAGVRNLERELAALCRAAAVRVAGGDVTGVRIAADSLEGILGPPRFISDVANLAPEVGVATAMAWTPTGGEIQFVEVRTMPGKGNLKLTGQVGDVMRESAIAALSYLRTHAARFGIDAGLFSAQDVHIHVPAGAVRKDGPSAGVAIAAALLSSFTRSPLRHDVAISGELTLRGRILPVGGIKEKVLAAHRAGITTVVLPEKNSKDLAEVPAEIRDALDIHLSARVDDAIEWALVKPRRQRVPLAPPIATLAEVGAQRGAARPPAVDRCSHSH